MLSYVKILGTMTRTIRNLYLISSRYIFCLSEGVLLWMLTLVGHIFGKLYSPHRRRQKPKLVKPMSKTHLSGSCGLSDDESEEEEQNNREFSSRKCKTWFVTNVVNSQNRNEMNEEDVIRFSQEISKDLEDIVFLVLAHKMNAARVGFFTAEEWMRGMRELEIDSEDKLLAKWEWLRSLLEDKTVLRNVYRFSFKFSRSPDRRNLEMYLCQGLIKIFFDNRWTLAGDFIEFLSSTNHAVMTYDEFCSVYEFQEHIQNDLSNYDFEGAWPILLDDFVVYQRQKTAPPPQDGNISPG